MLRLPDLVKACGVKSRAIADSAIVEEQMRPALADEAIQKLRCVSSMRSIADCFARSDVKFVVGERRFRLHRALLWARSRWFRSLLSEKWRDGRRARIEVSSMTAEVFASVVQFLYTGCGNDHIYRYQIDVCMVLTISNVAVRKSRLKRR